MAFMDKRYDCRKFIVQAHFKYWSQMHRKPGGNSLYLGTRMREDAVTCDFDAIKNIQGEAMQTQFIRSISYEVVLKAAFKVSGNDLTGKNCKRR